MIETTPTISQPWAAAFLERHVIPMLLAFVLGMLVMDWRAEHAQADRTQAWHDQLRQAHRDTAAANAALNRVLVLLADADRDFGAPAGVALPDGGELHSRFSSAGAVVAGAAAGGVVR